jgi:hypothetical protein
MMCQRNCSRKAAPGHRLCHRCHERSLAKQQDRGLSREDNKQRTRTLKRKADRVLDLIERERRR